MDEIGAVGATEAETVRQAVALFEVVGMPARNLAARTRREYVNDLHDLVKFLDGRGVRAIADINLVQPTFW